MGKHWHGIEYFFNLHEIENPKEIVYLMKIYEHELVSFRAKKAEEKRKADERRAKSGGKISPIIFKANGKENRNRY